MMILLLLPHHLVMVMDLLTTMNWTPKIQKNLRTLVRRTATTMEMMKMKMLPPSPKRSPDLPDRSGESPTKLPKSVNLNCLTVTIQKNSNAS